MSMLKGNYKLEKVVARPDEEDKQESNLLEQEYYKEAMSKLGGSIAFVMKNKTFLWTGDAKIQSSSEAAETEIPAPPAEEKK